MFLLNAFRITARNLTPTPAANATITVEMGNFGIGMTLGAPASQSTSFAGNETKTVDFPVYLIDPAYGGLGMSGRVTIAHAEDPSDASTARGRNNIGLFTVRGLRTSKNGRAGQVGIPLGALVPASPSFSLVPSPAMNSAVAPTIVYNSSGFGLFTFAYAVPASITSGTLELTVVATAGGWVGGATILLLVDS